MIQGSRNEKHRMVQAPSCLIRSCLPAGPDGNALQPFHSLGRWYFLSVCMCMCSVCFRARGDLALPTRMNVCCECLTKIKEGAAVLCAAADDDDDDAPSLVLIYPPQTAERELPTHTA